MSLETLWTLFNQTELGYSARGAYLRYITHAYIHSQEHVDRQPIIWKTIQEISKLLSELAMDLRV